MKKSILFEYEHFSSRSELSEAESDLLEMAEKATHQAYAPYSNFKVGAAVRMSSGNIVMGSNKENASFPAGICAERNAVSQALDRYHGDTISHIAIVANPEHFSISDAVAPCGICRQFIAEIETAQKQPIVLILSSMDGTTVKIEGVQKLLPLQFYMKQLQG